MSNIELNKLPDENDKNFYVNSMEWTQCPICLDKKFDSSGRWNKRNRDTHVKACIKQKRTEFVVCKLCRLVFWSYNMDSHYDEKHNASPYDTDFKLSHSEKNALLKSKKF